MRNIFKGIHPREAVSAAEGKKGPSFPSMASSIVSGGKNGLTIRLPRSGRRAFTADAAVRRVKVKDRVTVAKVPPPQAWCRLKPGLSGLEVADEEESVRVVEEGREAKMTRYTLLSGRREPAQRNLAIGFPRGVFPVRYSSLQG